jgi:hypothetical protein
MDQDNFKSLSTQINQVEAIHDFSSKKKSQQIQGPSLQFNQNNLSRQINQVEATHEFSFLH